MKTIDKSRAKASMVGIGGLLVCVGLSTVAFLTGFIAESASGGDASVVLSGGGFNIYTDYALRYAFIAICFAGCLIFLRVRSRALLLGNLLAMALASAQVFVLLTSKVSFVFDVPGRLLSFIGISYFFDHLIVGTVVALFALTAYLLWKSKGYPT